MVASRNSSLATRARRNPVLVVSPRIAVSSSAATSARRALSRSGPRTMTLPSIGSYDVLTTWPLSSAWSTRARAGQRTSVAVPACGQEPAEGVLGVDPGLDRVPADREVALAERQRLTGRHPQLELDQVDVRAGDAGGPLLRGGAHHDRLGDRVLDLEPGVHLQEVDLARRVVEQELDGAGVLVAHVRGQRDRRLGHGPPHLRGDRRGRGLLEHLLVAALRGAVALEEVHDVAVVVGEHLHLDVAAALDVLLDQDRVVAEGAGGLAARGRHRLVVRRRARARCACPCRHRRPRP